MIQGYWKQINDMCEHRQGKELDRRLKGWLLIRSWHSTQRWAGCKREDVLSQQSQWLPWGPHSPHHLRKSDWYGEQYVSEADAFNSLRIQKDNILKLQFDLKSQILRLYKLKFWSMVKSSESSCQLWKCTYRQALLTCVHLLSQQCY